MKKGRFKKTLSVALSMAMCSMAVIGTMPVQTVSATETAGDIITGISSLTVEKAAEGHVYKAYQIFTGDVSADGSTLSNIRYGKNYGETGSRAPEELISELEDGGAEAFAKKLTSDNTGGGYFWRPCRRADG